MKKRHSRTWPLRPKVSACLSSNFPWEIIFSFIQNHHRSVILLQMVNKSLYNTIKTNHLFFTNWFKRNSYPSSYLVTKVVDPLYPELKLFKSGLTGLPIHTGAPPASLENFTSYIRRLYALMHGTCCSMCGCRRRHDSYWSLRMRVCKLCMQQNTISSQTLHAKYGVDFTDIASEVAGKVFFFTHSVQVSEDRFAFHNATSLDISNKRLLYFFWLPHLQKILDLPALRMQQSQRKEAATKLTAALKRVYIISQRERYKDRHSVDCVLLSLYKNERKRLAQPYKRFVAKGNHEWSFAEPPFSKKCKYTFRNGESTERLYRRLSDWADYAV